MAATTTTAAAAIQTLYEKGLTNTIYTGVNLMGMIPFVPHTGGNSMNWKYKYASGDAEQAAEGDPAPAASNVSYANMTDSFVKVQHTVGWTGEMEDAMKGGYFDAVAQEVNSGIDKVRYKAEQLMIPKFIAAIDNSSTYGGQTRTTIHADSLIVNESGSAALTKPYLSSLYEGLRLAPRACDFSSQGDWFIVSSIYQETAYSELAGRIKVGDDESVGENTPYQSSDQNRVLDLGMFKHTFEYNKIPWFAWPNMTDGYVFLSRRSDWVGQEARALKMKALGAKDDSTEILITWRGGLYHRDPYRAGRIEGLTA